MIVTIWSWPELERAAGVADEGRDVGAEEVLALAEADDERAVAAGADDDAGAVGVHGEQGERALEPVDDVLHGLGEVAGLGVLAGHEVGGDLGVGLAREGRAVGDELVLQLVEVLDDAVVDQGELAVLAAAVRVGVLVGGAAVGGPAGVADAGRRARRGGAASSASCRLTELAGALLASRRRPSVDQGDARGVVAAVLEAGQALHDDVQGFAVGVRADVSHDSAHGQAA